MEYLTPLAVFVILFTCGYYLTNEARRWYRSYQMYRYIQNLQPSRSEPDDDEPEQGDVNIIHMLGTLEGMDFSLGQEEKDDVDYYFLVFSKEGSPSGENEVRFHWRVGDEDNITQTLYNYAVIAKEHLYEAERPGTTGSSEPDSSGDTWSEPS